MADEWSKPVKDGGEWFTRSGIRKLEPPTVWLDASGMVSIEQSPRVSDHAPRDVVLRLLAAEASDRLGWVWVVVNDDADGLSTNCYDHADCRWFVRAPGLIHSDSMALDTPDELLAAVHGRFLLEDALREAGR